MSISNCKELIDLASAERRAVLQEEGVSEKEFENWRLRRSQTGTRDLKVFGSVVRKLRGASGLDQPGLAASSDLALRVLQDIENGVIDPTMDQLYALSSGLGIPAHRLVLKADFAELEEGTARI